RPQENAGDPAWLSGEWHIHQSASANKCAAVLTRSGSSEIGTSAAVDAKVASCSHFAVSSIDGSTASTALMLTVLPNCTSRRNRRQNLILSPLEILPDFASIRSVRSSYSITLSQSALEPADVPTSIPNRGCAGLGDSDSRIEEKREALSSKTLRRR